MITPTLEMKHFGLPPKDADGMANNVDPDQTAEQSGLGFHCLLSPICSNI